MGNLGESTLRVALNFGDPAAFVSDLLDGTTLRIKLKGDTEDEIYRFSLSGSSISIRDAMKRCLTFNRLLKKNLDEEYFEEDGLESQPTPREKEPASSLDSSFF